MLTRLIVLAGVALGCAGGMGAMGAEPLQAPPSAASAPEAPGVADGPANEAATADSSAKGASQQEAPRVREKGPGHPQRLTPEQLIDRRVRTLTKALELNEAQQSKLKEILQNEHRQLSQVRTGSTQAGADRVGMMLAVLDRTREEIRAMLNEEQKKKYPAAVPRGTTAPASADLDYWMRRTQPPPAQTTEPGH
jgi:hypothetical protein